MISGIVVSLGEFWGTDAILSSRCVKQSRPDARASARGRPGRAGRFTRLVAQEGFAQDVGIHVLPAYALGKAPGDFGQRLFRHGDDEDAAGAVAELEQIGFLLLAEAGKVLHSGRGGLAVLEDDSGLVAVVAAGEEAGQPVGLLVAAKDGIADEAGKGIRASRDKIGVGLPLLVVEVLDVLLDGAGTGLDVSPVEAGAGQLRMEKQGYGALVVAAPDASLHVNALLGGAVDARSALAEDDDGHVARLNADGRPCGGDVGSAGDAPLLGGRAQAGHGESQQEDENLFHGRSSWPRRRVEGKARCAGRGDTFCSLLPSWPQPPERLSWISAARCGRGEKNLLAGELAAGRHKKCKATTCYFNKFWRQERA